MTTEAQKIELGKLIRQASKGIVFATDKDLIVGRHGEAMWAELAKHMEWN